MEHFVFIAVLDTSTRGMDETQLAAVIREFHPQVKIPVTKQALTAAAQAAIRSAGFEPYKLAVIVANAAAKQVLGKGLSFGLNALLTESISVFAGPVGIALTTFWAVNSLFFGEAYRVQVVDEVLERNTRATKAWRSAHDIRVDHNHWFCHNLYSS